MSTATRKAPTPAAMSYLRTLFTWGTQQVSFTHMQAAKLLNVNARTGREITELLVNHGLGTRNDATGEYGLEHYDTTADAQAAFKAAFNGKASAPAKEVKRLSRRADGQLTSGNLCGCGCKEQTNKGRLYLPGHDARHASQVAKAVAAGGSPILFDALPSQHLREKASAQAERIEAKASAPKAARKPAAKEVEGTFKIGRWTYDAVKRADGEIVKTNRDGSKIIVSEADGVFTAL